MKVLQNWIRIILEIYVTRCYMWQPGRVSGRLAYPFSTDRQLIHKLMNTNVKLKLKKSTALGPDVSASQSHSDESKVEFFKKHLKSIKLLQLLIRSDLYQHQWFINKIMMTGCAPYIPALVVSPLQKLIIEKMFSINKNWRRLVGTLIQVCLTV